MKRLLLCVCVLFLAIASGAEELNVAAAADLNFAMQEIAKKYHDETGNTLKVSYGSSGNFLVQIKNGAPFDLFFSADVEFPRELEAAGLAEPGTLYEYAVGKIVLWVPNGSKLDLSKQINWMVTLAEAKKVSSGTVRLAALIDPSVKKIAIANPKHAPYGRAAEAALKKDGIYDQVKDKLVLGENISQTAQFVDTGNADIGIIALSLAVAPTMKSHGRYVEVPSDLYPPIEQGAVVLKSSSRKQSAEQFLQLLKRPEYQAIFRSYGFAAPAER